jgi:hypothetical protein
MPGKNLCNYLQLGLKDHTQMFDQDLDSSLFIVEISMECCANIDDEKFIEPR